MTWPTPDTEADLVATDVAAGTNSPATARGSLFTVLVTRFNNLKALVNSIINFGEPALKAEALPTPTAISYSATPTLDAALAQTFYVGTLTGNITSLTVSNAHDGRPILIRFVQDATGARTIAVPAGSVIGGIPNGSANKVSWLTLIWVDSASRFEGFWSALS